MQHKVVNHGVHAIGLFVDLSFRALVNTGI